MSENKWELKMNGFQIADTGDYGGNYEITNGDISIFTEDDEEDTKESLKDVVTYLNKCGCKFYINDSLKYENHLIREQNERMTESLLDLLTEEEVFDILYNKTKEHEEV